MRLWYESCYPAAMMIIIMFKNQIVQQMITLVMSGCTEVKIRWKGNKSKFTPVKVIDPVRIVPLAQLLYAAITLYDIVQAQ